jgi:hypothetical protein
MKKSNKEIYNKGGSKDDVTRGERVVVVRIGLAAGKMLKILG